MNPIGTTGYNAAMIRSLVEMRASLNDLNTQLTTGQKAQTYGGLGAERSLALSLTSKISRLESYKATTDTLDIRLATLNTTVDRMNRLTSEVGGQMDLNVFNVLSDGKTIQQKVAGNALQEMVDLLNSDIAGSYLYGGRKSDTPPVVTVDEMLNGKGAQAGLKQIMAERLAADQGTGTGRLDATVTGSDVTLAEDGTHPFGFKLSAVTSTLSNATVTGPSGAPKSLQVSLTGLPQAGEAITVALTLPGGKTMNVKLIAGTADDPVAGTFAIGPDAATTAASLQSVLQGKLQIVAKQDLVAASAFAAADGFFQTFNGQPPQRVAGPPYATATALTNGTSADTVQWYQGDDAQNLTPGWSPRADVATLVDSSLSVQHGVRANEHAFAEAMARYAAVACVDVSNKSVDSKAVHAAMMQQAKSELAQPDDKIQSIELEIVHAQVTIKSVKDRHNTLKAGYGSTLDSIKNSDDTETAVKIQALQTRMQASYSATSILFKLSLTQYL